MFFTHFLTHWKIVPFYTIGVAYLIMTLICEMPLVYNVLKNKTAYKKKLAVTILATNTVTTALAVAAERTLCQGCW